MNNGNNELCCLNLFPLKKNALRQKPEYSRWIVYIGKNHYITAWFYISSYLLKKAMSQTATYLVLLPFSLWFIISLQLVYFILPLKEKKIQRKDST